jgi:SAM-dependent methyltransferase
MSELGERHPERFDPATMGGQMVEAEHVSRYLWAAPLAEGRRVLDAACGTGYGSAILAGAGAASVTAVDRSEEALRWARLAAKEGVRHERADLAALPFEDGAFDLVVCFEAIEHVRQPEPVLDELCRVLAPGGLLLISSPNRDVYTPGNPHHHFEYLPEELAGALGARLAHVAMLRQHNWLAAALLDDEAFAASDGRLLQGLRVHKVAARDPGGEVITVAAASDSPLPDLPPVAVIGHLEELRIWVEENRNLRALVLDLERRAAADRDDAVRRHAAELERRLAEAHDVMAEENRNLRAQVLDQGRDAADRDGALRRHAAELERRLAEAHDLIGRFNRSMSWRVTAPLRAAGRLARSGRRAMGSRVR